MSAPDDDTFLFDQTNAVLTFALSLFPANHFDRAYVNYGQPQPACSELVTWVSSVGVSQRPTQPQGTTLRKQTVPYFQISVGIYDCVTGLTNEGNVPPGTTPHGESAAILEDVWVLFRGIVRAALDGTLFTDLDCEHILVRQGTPVVPDNIAGYVIVIEVPLG